MSDMLSIGASGLRAYQSALGTVADNIANASSAGYTRKTTNLREVAAATSIQAKTTLSGVATNGIVRSADEFLSADVRASSADLARTESGVTWLDRIESSLSGAQLSTRITSFFAAGQTLAADPSSIPARASMLESANSVATAFRATGEALDRAATDLNTTAASAVNDLNDLSSAMARVNDSLVKAPAGSGTAAALLDQRDDILEKMSALTNVSVSTDQAGRATVRMGDASGPVLVSGTDAGTVTYAQSSGGSVSFIVNRLSEATSANPTGGALAGVVDSAQRIVEARDQLNTTATKFTTDVNAIQAQGEDLNGTAGAAIFATGSSPTDVTVTLTDPKGIAAAAVGGGTRDNGNLTALQAIRTSGGYEASLTNQISSNAATLAARKDVADAQSSIRDSALASRSAVSGVNLDEEAVNLLRFQQAYQASSRVIQAAREMVQTLLDIR